jgi:hypothetical protein
MHGHGDWSVFDEGRFHGEEVVAGHLGEPADAECVRHVFEMTNSVLDDKEHEAIHKHV